MRPDPHPGRPDPHRLPSQLPSPKVVRMSRKPDKTHKSFRNHDLREIVPGKPGRRGRTLFVKRIGLAI